MRSSRERSGCPGSVGSVSDGDTELGEDVPESRRKLEQQADRDVAVERTGRQGRIGEMHDAIDIRVESVGKSAKSGST